jgi:hypothetical protein
MKFPKLTPKLKRIFAIVLASLGVLMLVLLAASLTNVKLKPAQAFITLPEQQEPLFDFPQFMESAEKLSVGEALMLVGGFLVLFVLMLAMLSPEARKRLIRMVLRIVLTAWVILLIMERFRSEGILEVEQRAVAAEDATPVFVTPPPYTPPVIPSWAVYVVSLLVVLILAGIGFWMYRVLRPPKYQLKGLARAARSALKDLSAGRDWDDTVIQCYVRMSEALGQERGLHRQQGMTPQEFASRLEQAGLPSDPVRRLTRLFEKARYGGRKSSREDVNEAVTCLTAILHAVGAQP